MKIEKLTENKIQIILKNEDFKDKNIDIKNLLYSTPESNTLFLEILNIAKKEVNFDTDGYKLLIEANFVDNGTYIFTITKYVENTNTITYKQNKLLTVKRKNQKQNNCCYIYQFENFENFCNFCNFINKNKNITANNLYKSSILYLYNNTYYLVIDNIDLTNKLLEIFHSSLLEFSNLFSSSKNFKFKLKEHGKIIIKNNAINTGIKYFSRN